MKMFTQKVTARKLGYRSSRLSSSEKKYQLGRVAKVKMSKQLHHSVTNLFRFAQQQLKRES